MTSYSIKGVDDRRVNEKDGALEYLVSWQCSSPALYRTWEPRAALDSGATDVLHVVDQAAMKEVDAEVTAWRAEPHHPWNTLTRSPHSTATCCADGDERTKRSQKRCREDAEAEVERAMSCPSVETLSAVVWRCPAEHDHEQTTLPQSRTAVQDGVAVLLGEVILTEDVVGALTQPTNSHAACATASGSGGGRRKRAQPHVTSARSPREMVLCAAARRLDAEWRAQFGHDPLRSCAAAIHMTPLSRHLRSPGSESLGYPHAKGRQRPSAFTLTAARSSRARRLEDERGGRVITIVGIAPAQESVSARPFVAPVSFVPWLGTDASEELRRRTLAEKPQLAAHAGACLDAHCEQLVVRYLCPRVLTVAAAAPSRQIAATHGSDNVITAMPLSIFRSVFPQLLLDYLLQNTFLLHGGVPPH